mmetsp:Transcript_21192/g.62619  ORF Transcript_21192/g.62619 Transcript_21192/m.62619 type:complete len:254 (-) Transcript_21192:701-1462(-)
MEELRGMCSSQLARLLHHDALLHRRPECPDETLHGPCGRVAQRADRVALDLLADFHEHVDLLQLGVTRDHAVHDLVHPGGALAAWRALAAALVRVELGEAADRSHNVSRLVENRDRRGAQARAHVLEGVKVHEHIVAGLLGHDGHGRAARDHSQEVVPAAAHAAAVLLEEFPEGDAHLLLDGDGVVHVARDAEELGARIVFAPKTGEPVTAPSHDGRRHRHRLHVGDGGRAAVEPCVGRERGLQARLSRLALE